MRRLSVQLQPDRSPTLDVRNVVTLLESLAIGVRVSEANDDGRYVNLDFEAADLSGLWESIRREVKSIAGLSEAAIIVCEGEIGWDDYLLLHHYDPTEALNQLQ